MSRECGLTLAVMTCTIPDAYIIPADLAQRIIDLLEDSNINGPRWIEARDILAEITGEKK